MKTHEKLHKYSHFYANFHASVSGVFDWIFIKFSRKCRTMKSRMINFIVKNFCSFFNWEGAIIRPQISPRKIPGSWVNGAASLNACLKQVCLVFLKNGQIKGVFKKVSAHLCPISI